MLSAFRITGTSISSVVLLAWWRNHGNLDYIGKGVVNDERSMGPSGKRLPKVINTSEVNSSDPPPMYAHDFSSTAGLKLMLCPDCHFPSSGAASSSRHNESGWISVNDWSSLGYPTPKVIACPSSENIDFMKDRALHVPEP